MGKAKESPNKILRVATIMVASIMVLYQLAAAWRPFVTPVEHLNLHLGFALLLVVLSTFRGTRLWLLTLSILLALAPIVYIHFSLDALEARVGVPFPPTIDLVLGLILILVVLEAMRRSYGIILVIVVTCFILYNFFGYLLPVPFGSSRFTPLEIISRLSLGSLGASGMYGTFLRTSATLLFLFILFGSMLVATGAVTFFNEIGKWIGQKFISGPAMTAVVSSALVGMCSGSGMANVVTTGTFTIPLMKACGYKPHQAGAIEAAASSGGQIMPPVMGTAAFLLADFVGIPYAKVMLMAVIPAMLWYLSVGCYVQFQALKLNLKPKVQEYSGKEMLLTAPVFVIPVGLLVIMLLSGYSAAHSVSLALVLTIALSFVRKETRPSFNLLIEKMAEGAVSGAKLATTCAGLGLVHAVLTWTGLGVRIPQLVEFLSGGVLIIGVFLVMIASLILGMGLPTPAVYVLVAIAAAPALVRMGAPLLPVHMFVFWYGIIAGITPPVALTALVAARLASAPYFKTGFEATKICLGGIITAFLFIYCPELLLLNLDDPIGAAAIIVGTFALVAIVEVALCSHYLRKVDTLQRALFTVLAVTLFASLAMKIYALIAVVVVVFAFITLWQLRKRKRLAPAPDTG